MTFTLLEIIVIACVAFWLGSRLTMKFQEQVFMKILQDLGITTDQLQALNKELNFVENDDGVKLEEMEIRIEEYQGRLYVYRVSDNKFLAQGEDREKLIESLTQNLTNVRLIVSEENGAGFIKNGS